MTTRAPKNLNTSVNRSTRVENNPGKSEDSHFQVTSLFSDGYEARSGQTPASENVPRQEKTSAREKAPGRERVSHAEDTPRPTKASGEMRRERERLADSSREHPTQGRTQSKKRAKKKKRSNIISITIIIVAAGVFIFAAIKLISALTNYGTADNSYSEIREIFTVAENVSKPTEIVTRENGETTVQEVEWVYDYDKLLAINSDSIGYLKMQAKGDDVVDYPVVQGYDNDYYLDHLFDGTENNSGAIFMDCNADYGFDSSYAIIYGHNMKAGARMFGCLHNYRNESYFQSHQLWDVYAGYDKYTYRTFAAFEASVDSFVYDYYDSSDVIYLAESAINNSDYDMGYGIENFSEDSRVLCLSTCLDNYSSNYRYVVFIVRVS